MTRPPVQEVVPGVFGTRAQAEAAIAELRALGLRDEEIGVAVPEPGRYQLMDDATERAFREVPKAFAAGASLGSLAGVGLMALVVPGAGVLGVGGLLVGLYGGALWGGFAAAFGRLVAKVRWNDAEDRWCEIPLAGGDILVAARAGDRVDEVRRVMERHGARCFLDQAKPAQD